MGLFVMNKNEVVQVYSGMTVWNGVVVFSLCYAFHVTFDPQLLVAIGDVLLNLSAGWFGAAIILLGASHRRQELNTWYVFLNVVAGVAALVFGYKFRIIGL